MWKLYSHLVWNRIRGLRGLGILALSVAFCLTGALALSSCDDDDDEMAMAPEPMEMRGFFISADAAGSTVCSIENADVYLEGDESTGKLNISFTTAGSQFQASFNNEGFKIIEDAGDKKTIVTAYVSETTDGSFTLPGSYYLASRTDADVVDGETIFAGYWVGHAFRPSGNPVVICPYVLVPRSAIDKEGCGGTTTTNADGKEVTSNGTDPTMIHMGLQKYLTQGGGGNEFRACYEVFDADGYVGPHQRMQ